ncbi:hypothetical protein ACVBEF_14125 [Glaciimonas sp. GG7]
MTAFKSLSTSESAPQQSEPIRIVGKEEARNAVESMQYDIRENWHPIKMEEFYIDNPVAVMQQEKWNSRIEGSMALLRQFDFESDVLVVGYAKGEGDEDIPAGVMSMDMGRSEGRLEINQIIVHPGIQALGPVMMEEAVNISHAEGYFGELSLSALYGADAYKSLGFVAEENTLSRMYLVPDDQPDKWDIVDNKWKFIGNSGIDPLSPTGC